MNADEARTEAARILDADLRDLTAAGDPPVLAPAVCERWDLPADDRRALRTYGLPGERQDGPARVAARFQTAGHPALGHRDIRGYLLGTFLGTLLAARPGTGAVLALPAADPRAHPDLRHLPADAPPAAVPVNSTVARFVDCAWRWHHLAPLLAAQRTRIGRAWAAAWPSSADAAPQGVPPAVAALRDEYEGLCRYVLNGLHRRDPEAITAEDSFWPDIVLD